MLNKMCIQSMKIYINIIELLHYKSLYARKTICQFVLINNFYNKLTTVLIGDNQTVFVNTVNADFMIDSRQTLCIFAIGVLSIGLS